MSLHYWFTYSNETGRWPVVSTCSESTGKWLADILCTLCISNQQQYLNKLFLLSLQCLLAPLNNVSKLICVEDGGVTPAQMPLFNVVLTGLPAAASLPVLLAELVCRCIPVTHSADVDAMALEPAPSSTVGKNMIFNKKSDFFNLNKIFFYLNRI